MHFFWSFRRKVSVKSAPSMLAPSKLVAPVTYASVITAFFKLQFASDAISKFAYRVGKVGKAQGEKRRQTRRFRAGITHFIRAEAGQLVLILATKKKKTF